MLHTQNLMQLDFPSMVFPWEKYYYKNYFLTWEFNDITLVYVERWWLYGMKLRRVLVFHKRKIWCIFLSHLSPYFAEMKKKVKNIINIMVTFILCHLLPESFYCLFIWMLFSSWKMCTWWLLCKNYDISRFYLLHVVMSPYCQKLLKLSE